MPGGVRRLDQFAVDVELQLLHGSVANPDRLRSAIALQVVEHIFGEAVVSVDRVHDLEALGMAIVRHSHPAQKAIDLIRKSHLVQRVDEVGGVADPGESVIPIQRSAQALGQGSRGRRDEGAGRQILHQLQRQRRAVQRLVEAPAVSRRPKPRDPVVIGLVQVDVGVLERNRGGKLATSFHMVEQHGGTVPRHHPAGDDRDAVDQFERRVARILEVDAAFIAFDHEHPGADRDQLGHPAAEVEARLEGQLPVGRAGDRLHHADQAQRVRGPPPLALDRDRHPIDHPHPGAVAAPDGLHHIGVTPVLAEGERFAGRAELEVTAMVPIEQPAEDPRTVKARQAHPVDRAGLADQCRGPKVADHPIVTDRRIAGVSIAHLRRLRTWRGPRISGGWLRTQMLSSTAAHIRYGRHASARFRTAAGSGRSASR